MILPSAHENFFSARTHSLPSHFVFGWATILPPPGQQKTSNRAKIFDGKANFGHARLPAERPRSTMLTFLSSCHGSSVLRLDPGLGQAYVT